MASMTDLPLDRARRILRLRAGFATGLVVLATEAVFRLAGCGFWIAAIAATVLGGAAAAALASGAEVRVSGAPAPGMPASRGPVAAPGAAPMPAGSDDARWRSLRHDLRGILSPAMLIADRLLLSTEDALAKKSAEAMIDAIERAARRLDADRETRAATGHPASGAPGA